MGGEGENIDIKYLNNSSDWWRTFYTVNLKWEYDTLFREYKTSDKGKEFSH